MRRVLVTGGAGFIGSAVVRHLTGELGVEVLNVDKLTYAGNLESLRPVSNLPNYRFARADICDRAALDALFAEFRPDGVMHLAAESHVDRSITGAGDFVHVSTDEVYGSLGAEGLFAETTPYDPSSPYSASKAASDHLAQAWMRTYGLPVVISNCSNNYGPFHFPEKLIPLVTLNALEGKPLPVYGRGDNIRDWLYVEDHARALWTILTTGRLGEKYNVGGRNERTNLDVVETICDVLDELRPMARSRRELITFVTDRPGHDQRYAIDATKLEDELGWRAREDFASGIRRTVSSYLDNEGWWRPLREGVYSGERLGLDAKKG